MKHSMLIEFVFVLFRNVKRKERKEKSVDQEDLSDEVVEKKPPKKKLGRPLGVKNKTVSSGGGAKEKKKQRKRYIMHLYFQ